MRYKHKTLSIFIGFISLLWILFELFVLCKPDSSDDFTCTGEFIYSLGDISQVLFLFPLAFIILSAISFFTNEIIFLSLIKFAKWYLPLAFILILLMGFSDDGGSWGVSADFDAEITIWLTASVFLVASLIIIAVKSWKLRRG